jgi:hypothetical protein
LADSVEAAAAASVCALHGANHEQRLDKAQRLRWWAARRAREAGIAPQPKIQFDASPTAMAARKARLDEAAETFATMPVLDPRPAREIMDDLNIP